jgi:hypothetical protein
MEAATEWLGWPVLGLGVIGLIFGALLIVRARKVAAQVLQATKDEKLPNLTVQGRALVIDPASLIDTPEKIRDSSNALKTARWAAANPMDLTGKTNVWVRTPAGEAPFIPQTNCAIGEILLNFANFGLEFSKLVRILGILTLALSAALIIAGITLSGI